MAFNNYSLKLKPVTQFMEIMINIFLQVEAI